MDGTAEHGDERLTEEVGRRLLELEGVIPPTEIGELWVFPPLEEPEDSREFVLFTRFGENGTRRLYSARVPPSSQGERREIPGPDGYTPERDRKMANRRNGDGDDADDELPEQRVTEHGEIPAGRLPGLVQRFRRRLGDDRVPVHVEVDGSRERWIELLGPVAAAGDDANGASGVERVEPAGNGDARANGAGAPDHAGAAAN